MRKKEEEKGKESKTNDWREMGDERNEPNHPFVSASLSSLHLSLLREKNGSGEVMQRQTIKTANHAVFFSFFQRISMSRIFAIYWQSLRLQSKSSPMLPSAVVSMTTSFHTPCEAAELNFWKDPAGRKVPSYGGGIPPGSGRPPLLANEV